MKKEIVGAFLFALLLIPHPSIANPYLPKPGERPLSMRISTCAVSGGFVHLYTALDNGLFDKYGMKFENIFIRGSGPNLSALSGDEVQFTYCAADATIPGLAAGVCARNPALPFFYLSVLLVMGEEDRGAQQL